MSAEIQVVREFGTELARDAVSSVAPAELEMFDEVADEYWADPEAAVAADDRDEELGFGIELAVLAPFAIAIATAVGKYLLDLLSTVFADEAKPLLAAKLRALLRRKPAADAAAPALTPRQFDQVRKVAIETAERLRLAPDTARVLADAIVGGLVAPAVASDAASAHGDPSR